MTSRVFFCDENLSHTEEGEDEGSGFSFPPHVSEPQPCPIEFCPGMLWLNLECQHWFSGTHLGPPEQCSDRTAAGDLFCARHQAAHESDE